MKLWNFSTTYTAFLNDSGLPGDAAKYQSCFTENFRSVILKDTALDVVAVVYYNGTTPGSRVCFICDGHESNTTINERVCQSDASWSGSPIACGMCIYLSVSLYIFM